MTEGEVAYVIPWYLCKSETVFYVVVFLLSVDHVVIGGTMQDGNWSTESSPIDRASILEKCYRLEPSLKVRRMTRNTHAFIFLSAECSYCWRVDWFATNSSGVHST